MLVECEREIPEHVIKKAMPVAPSDRKERPQQVVKIHGQYLETDGGLVEVRSVSDLVKVVLETNTIVAESLVTFHQFLNSICDATSLMVDRSVDDENYKLMMADMVCAFLVVRKGRPLTAPFLQKCSRRQSCLRRRLSPRDVFWFR